MNHLASEKGMAAGRAAGPASAAAALPAFVRVEDGMPLGRWARIDSGTIVVGSAVGLALTVIDRSLAPHHLGLWRDASSVHLASLEAGAELRVEGIPTRRARLVSPARVSIGDTHLLVLPPPTSTEGCSMILRSLRGWMRPDPATGLPTAAHLFDVLEEGCSEAGGICQQALLLVRPEHLGPLSTGKLRASLGLQRLICLVGEGLCAAHFPDGLPRRHELPMAWPHAAVRCAEAGHRPERILALARERLQQKIAPGWPA